MAETRRKDNAFEYASNAVRLSGRQWLIVAGLSLAAMVVPPLVWPAFEPLELVDGYRIPYELSDDYWRLERVIDAGAGSPAGAVVLGDSVAWGQFVRNDRTLSHYLDDDSGTAVVNLGVDGLHPAAMEGLVRHYGGSLRNDKTLVLLNLSWMSDPQHDLSTPGEARFNHPGLVRQFADSPPAYKAEFGDRLSRVAARYIPLLPWREHVQTAYYERMSVYDWTLRRPYRCPFAPLAEAPPGPTVEPHVEPTDWRSRGLAPADFDWVDAERSYQWAMFRRMLELLRSRENDVLVVVSPFNRHMLTEAGRAGHDRLLKGTISWFEANNISYITLTTLPSDEYADASHPLAAGYERLAKELRASAEYREWMK